MHLLPVFLSKGYIDVKYKVQTLQGKVKRHKLFSDSYYTISAFCRLPHSNTDQVTSAKSVRVSGWDTGIGP